MSEELCTVGDVELCYERFGDPAQPTLLLIMGLGTQMLAWHEAFCERLVARGFHVVRYDNRDVGRSSAMTALRPPTRLQLARRRRAAGYSLADMADDAAGLLDRLGVERAHVVGASMGGMIAQTLAIRHPQRMLSLCSIMSSTGARLSGRPSPRVLSRLLTPAPRDRDGWIEHTASFFRLVGSPGFDHDEAQLRERLGLAYDRGINPAGTLRQLAAVVAERDRTPRLRRLDVPALVIHGTADRLVASSGGRATARAIPGARLLEIEGMGHDLPPAAWPRIVDAIAANAARAGATAAPAAPRR